MHIWTHRGNPGPENTIEAFTEAWENGVRHFETDIHCTKDGVLVLAHDPDISRLSKNTSRISEMNFSELQKFRIAEFGSWTVLDELIEKYPDAIISIDIKSNNTLAPFILWAQNKRLDNFVIGSFSSKRTKAIRNAYPHARTALTPFEVLVINIGAAWSLKKIDNNLVAMVPLNFRGIPVLTKRFQKFCNARRIEIHVWTINSPTEFHKIKSLGVDGVITDNYLEFLI